MSVAIEPLEADTETGDHSALRLMLSYVESECLRIGATDAARHAAMAASLMPKGVAPQVESRPRSRNARLH
ncbi:hypothetical protein JMJ55_17145 [Belnapia sp. T6]|uniref:Uncharacterized protein n=1 Tax=Belnapia mucosa TaxID=2804532 RepID=A0ABS1V5U9_9PROT|nr:hypothetical protein [Belnapia mucosa]MBL6457065.1 hypothetical protein [Belnapia mucosa]